MEGYYQNKTNSEDEAYNVNLNSSPRERSLTDFLNDEEDTHIGQERHIAASTKTEKNRSPKKKSSTVVVKGLQSPTKKKTKKNFPNIKRQPKDTMLDIPTEFTPNMDRVASACSARESPSGQSMNSSRPRHSIYNMNDFDDVDQLTSSMVSGLSITNDTVNQTYADTGRPKYRYYSHGYESNDRSECVDTEGLSPQHDRQYASRDDHVTSGSGAIDETTAKYNMMFFQQVATDPGFYGKKSEVDDLSIGRRRQGYVPDDPKNYISEAKAAENLDFFRTIARTPGFFEVPRNENEVKMPMKKPKSVPNQPMYHPSGSRQGYRNSPNQYTSP